MSINTIIDESDSNIFELENNEINKTIKELRDKETQKETIEFGNKMMLDIDIDNIVNGFMNTVFELGTSNENIEAYSKKNNISVEEAEKKLKLKVISKLKGIPDSSGIRPNSDQNKEDSGLANIVKTFVKLIIKVVGYGCEFFMTLLKPIQTLINQFISNPSNPGKLSDVVYNQLKIASTTGTPAQSIWIGEKIIQIKELLESIQTIIKDLLDPIVSIIGDINGFIIEQVLGISNNLNKAVSNYTPVIKEKEKDIEDLENLKTEEVSKRVSKRKKKANEEFDNRRKDINKSTGVLAGFTPSIPPLNLGILNIKIPGFDMIGSNVDLTSPINSGLLAYDGVKDFDVDKYMDNPLEVISKLGYDTKGIEKPKNRKIPDINIDEILYFKRLYEDPILQFDYMKGLKKHKYDSYFYKQPFNPETNKYDNSFDFFKKINLYTDEKTKEKGLYECLVKSGLIKEKDFIVKVYELLESYKFNLPSVSDTLKEEYNKNGYNILLEDKTKIKITKNGFMYKNKNVLVKNGYTWERVKDIDSVWGFVKKNNKLNSSDFIKVLEQSFKLNFWNTELVDNKEVTRKEGESDYDFKRFKFNFWELIPENKLKYFMTFTNKYILYFKEVSEFKDNLSTDISTVLKYSNDATINGVKIEGALNDNAFRKTVKLPNKFEKLFPTEYYDKTTGLPNLKPETYGYVRDGLFDKLPAFLLDLLTKADFMKNIIMMPLNFLLGFLEKILKIILDCITVNIPSAFNRIKDFVSDLMPSLDFFTKIGKTIIHPFEVVFKSFLDKLIKGKKGAEHLIELYTKPFVDLFKRVMEAIPKLLFDTLPELFKVVLSSITEMIPIIEIKF